MKTTNNFERLNLTPTIPESVYDNLPTFLKEITDQFTDPREKDVILTCSMTILSGCFNIEGVYSNDWVYPNIYGFVVAPPASGKGVMKYAELLGKKLQSELLKSNEEARGRYKSALAIWKRQVKKDATTAGEQPQKPKYPVFFIPGNSSSASIYRLLNESNGKGLICESEADTLAGAIKQDWGKGVMNISSSGMFRAKHM